MRSFALSTAAIALTLSLAACGGKEDTALEKGQVLATVSGIDVTANELNAELIGVPLPPPGEQRKAIEQQALQGLVDRTILAAIAREKAIDKTDIYIAQKRRADENLLVLICLSGIKSAWCAAELQPVTRQLRGNCFHRFERLIGFELVHILRHLKLNLIKRINLALGKHRRIAIHECLGFGCRRWPNLAGDVTL